VADQPLSSATHRSLGEPLPHQQANGPRAHPSPADLSRVGHATVPEYPVLAQVSLGYPSVRGKLPTCYSPVRRSIHPPKRALIARLACVKHAASVHPEPGSNSPCKSSRANTPAIHEVQIRSHPDRSTFAAKEARRGLDLSTDRFGPFSTLSARRGSFGPSMRTVLACHSIRFSRFKLRREYHL
jgi:hypothetical protein